MSKRKSSQELEPKPVDRDWNHLCERFPLLTAGKEAIYALPGPLIERIQAEATGFFDEEQLAFESALNEGDRTGFFLGRSFHSALLSVADPASEDRSDLGRQIKKMLADEIRATGAGKREVDDYFAIEVRLKRELFARQRGYAGWLVTDAGFHVARESFRREWRRDFEAQESRPTLPVSDFGETPKSPDKKDLPFFVAYWMFLQKWCLRGLCTWELPIPIQASVANPSEHPHNMLGDAGCSVFVPWYLARDQKLTLRDILGHESLITSLNHLQDWLEKSPNNLGHERFGQMLQLYVYYELALKARYSDRLRRNTKAIDRALGQYLKQVDLNSDSAITVGDSVKKIREEMSQRLKRCEDLSPWKKKKRSKKKKAKRSRHSS